MSPMAVTTSVPVIVFLLDFWDTMLAEEVAYSTNTLAAYNNKINLASFNNKNVFTLAIAVLASLDTLQLAGKQSLMILVTMEVGRFRSSGLSAIMGLTLSIDLKKVS